LAGSQATGTPRLFHKENERQLLMPQMGTNHLHGHDLQRAARNKLATYSLRFAAQSSGDADGKTVVL